MAIIAIALTTLLFTGLLTIGISMMDYVQQQTMRQVGTTAHGGFKFLSQEQYEKVLGDPKLEDVSANIFVGTAKNPQLKKQMTEVRWFEDDRCV